MPRMFIFAVLITGIVSLFMSWSPIGKSIQSETGVVEPGARNVYSYTTMLGRIWEDYKTQFITEEGRTIDPDKDNITTSEGQAYSMLRAVWIDDKETFDRLWGWTGQNLQHETDALFSWLYGETTAGTFGILETQGGASSASDADSDIALALIFASRRWKNSDYNLEAKKILQSMWDREVLVIGNVAYLTANDKETSLDKTDVLINPSYCSPHAYRIFAADDSDHPWQQLVDSCYQVILTQEVGLLPPDWLVIDRHSGILKAPPYPLSVNYGYDAFRLPFKLFLDYRWFGDDRAMSALQRFGILADDWNTEKRLYAVYDRGGQPESFEENMALYAGNLGYFIALEPGLASKILKQKILSNYNADTGTWYRRLSYYEANLVWFAIALYANELHNLASVKPTPP